MHLRPYQRRALDALAQGFRRGHRSQLVVMPTGTGKTVLFAEVARLAPGPVLVLAHRQELVEQARAKISTWCDDVVAVEMAERRDLTRGRRFRRPKVTVASVQSLSRRLHDVPPDAFRLIVIDEAHHSTADTYRCLIDQLDARVLGVTATPDRADGERLGDVFDHVAFVYEMVTAIDDGWLCPIRSFLVETRADVSSVRKVAGELSTGDLEEILTRDPHLAEIAHPIVRERGERSAMVFAVSVAHAHALSRVLCEVAGDPGYAVALDGGAPGALRRETIRRFAAGEIKVLVNCALFTEGFDVPRIGLVAIARPILSRSLYAQMVGRGTRIAPGKRDLLVLDFVPANCRHPLVCSVDIFDRHDAEVAQRARRIVAASSEAGEPLALSRALDLARQEVEALQASVEYRLTQRDPFESAGIDVAAVLDRSGVPGADPPASAAERAALRRAGLPASQAAGLSRSQFEALSERLRQRRATGLCSPRQAHQLARYGIDARAMYDEEARMILGYIRRHREKTPAEIRADLDAGAIGFG